MFLFLFECQSMEKWKSRPNANAFRLQPMQDMPRITCISSDFRDKTIDFSFIIVIMFLLLEKLNISSTEEMFNQLLYYFTITMKQANSLLRNRLKFLFEACQLIRLSEFP